MVNIDELIDEIGYNNDASQDTYGYYNEFEIILGNELEMRSMYQLSEYIPTDDYMVFPYLRVYDDGSKRIFATVCDENGFDVVTEELELEDEEFDALMELDL